MNSNADLPATINNYFALIERHSREGRRLLRRRRPRPR
jgi:hypothetical protein